jgi:hypothetical protein
MVELHRSEIDRLAQHGLLRAAERDDEGAVVDALSANARVASVTSNATLP